MFAERGGPQNCGPGSPLAGLAVLPEDCQSGEFWESSAKTTMAGSSGIELPEDCQPGEFRQSSARTAGTASHGSFGRGLPALQDWETGSPLPELPERAVLAEEGGAHLKKKKNISLCVFYF
jgi:hypothetical protein